MEFECKYIEVGNNHLFSYLCQERDTTIQICQVITIFTIFAPRQNGKDYFCKKILIYSLHVSDIDVHDGYCILQDSAKVQHNGYKGKMESYYGFYNSSDSRNISAKYWTCFQKSQTNKQTIMNHFDKDKLRLENLLTR